MNVQTKEFHLGDVLSITTGRLVSPTLMGGVYDILNFMTDDSLFTHQLPRASRECRPYLLEQFPQLKDVDTSGVNKDNYKQWLVEQVAKYGECFLVKPIPEYEHEFRDAIEEAVEMRDDKGNPTERVIVVQI